MLHGLGDDNEAVGQNVTMDIARIGDHGGHLHIVAQGRIGGEWRVTCGELEDNSLYFLYIRAICAPILGWWWNKTQG
jgi:hypothetical protein